MPLLSDNAYAQAMRAPRVVLPPYTVHTMARSRAIEAAGRQAATTAGFVARTQGGLGMRELYDPFSAARWSPVPERATGRIVSAGA